MDIVVKEIKSGRAKKCRKFLGTGLWNEEENFSTTPVGDFNSTFPAKNTEDRAKCNKVEGQIF